MSKLTSDQIQEYGHSGYVSPIDVLTKDKTINIKKRNRIY